MGELRSNHFHSGIDIRTNNTIGLPVLASKSGYISRVAVSPSGYGNALYVAHPDGNTTVYAHLDRFRGPIVDYVLNEHYRRKASRLSLFFRPGQFPVHQGDTIAFSGNSGSSGGPHLHFDIRDSNNLALNPLLVEAFPEIVDNLPPAVEKIALRTLDINSRINDRFGRFEFYAKRIGNNYVFSAPILATGNIGVEILAKDKLAPGSRFHGGVNYIEMKVDSQTVFNQSIEKINFGTTRSIFTLMDFKTLRTNGARFYKLYLDDGNKLNFYDRSPGDGKIRVKPGDDAQVVITMKDTYGNRSNVSFVLRPSPLSDEAMFLASLREDVAFDIEENVLVVSAKPCGEGGTTAMVYRNGEAYSRGPDYGNENQLVFLFDLRKEIPDSILVCDNTVFPGVEATVPSGNEYTYYSDLIDIKFPSGALYDTAYLHLSRRMNEEGHGVYTIGAETTPLDRSIQIAMRPSGISGWKDNMAVYCVNGGGQSFLGGKWENGRIHFNTRELGEFMILEDTLAPAIRPVAVNGTGARFRIGDGLSGIDSFEASIDGRWLLMLYDPKTATIWSERLDNAQSLKGELKLVVTDRAGNTSTFTQQIH